MRILFLTQILPFPPDAGPKVKTWHVLRYLAQMGHQVILASFTRPEDEAFLPQVKELIQDIYPVPIRRSRIRDMGYFLRSVVTGRPFLVERDDQEDMRAVVRDIIANQKIDLIHADQLTMAQFGLPYKASGSSRRPRLVFDAHNAVWTIMQRMVANVPWYIKPAVKLEAWKVKRYEGVLLQKCDHILAVTDIDQASLLQAWKEWRRLQSSDQVARPPAGITVIPIAVDTELIQPVFQVGQSKNIFTMGTLHYPPNADGIRWFVKEVFPLIRSQDPSVTLTIAGRNPPSDFSSFSQDSGGAIQVTGYVPELAPYMRQAGAVVVPVRAGSGMRVRILESFAYGMPVVTTSIGLEGIDARSGEEVLVADAPAAFAAAVLNVLQNQQLQSRLSANARSLVVAKYDWMSALRQMDPIYADNRS